MDKTIVVSIISGSAAILVVIIQNMFAYFAKKREEVKLRGVTKELHKTVEVQELIQRALIESNASYFHIVRLHNGGSDLSRNRAKNITIEYESIREGHYVNGFKPMKQDFQVYPAHPGLMDFYSKSTMDGVSYAPHVEEFESFKYHSDLLSIFKNYGIESTAAAYIGAGMDSKNKTNLYFLVASFSHRSPEEESAGSIETKLRTVSNNLKNLMDLTIT